MKKRIKGYRQLADELKKAGVVIGEPVSGCVYDVISINGVRTGKDSVVCKVYINTPFSTVQSEYLAASKAYAADPEHFMRVYGRPLLFTVRDLTFGGINKCSAVLFEKGVPLSTGSDPIRLDWYVSFLRDIAAAAETLHRLGIVHLDIKPGNIVSSNGRYCLIDFNISKFIGYGDEINLLTHMGSGFYMAPDIFNGVLSGACDVYSLGMTVRGILLRDVGSMRGSYADDLLAQKKALEPLHSDDPDIQKFLDLINHMTAFSVGNRIRSMSEVIRELATLRIDPHTRLYSAYESAG